MATVQKSFWISAIHYGYNLGNIIGDNDSLAAVVDDGNFSDRIRQKTCQKICVPRLGHLGVAAERDFWRLGYDSDCAADF